MQKDKNFPKQKDLQNKIELANYIARLYEKQERRKVIMNKINILAELARNSGIENTTRRLRNDIVSEYTDIIDSLNIVEESVIIKDISLLPVYKINEEKIYGVKIDKNKLNDEKYVKDLIKKINEAKTQKNKSNLIELTLFILGAISFITIIGIPVGLLLIAISSAITDIKTKINIKDLKKIDSYLEKSINKLKKSESKAEGKEKKEYQRIIKKLEKNRKYINDNLNNTNDTPTVKRHQKTIEPTIEPKEALDKVKILFNKNKSKYKDLSKIKLDFHITYVYDEFIRGDENYLDIASFEPKNIINKTEEELRNDDDYDFYDYLWNLLDDINKDLNKYGYSVTPSEDSDIYRGGIAIEKGVIYIKEGYAIDLDSLKYVVESENTTLEEAIQKIKEANNINEYASMCCVIPEDINKQVTLEEFCYLIEELEESDIIPVWKSELLCEEFITEATNKTSKYWANKIIALSKKVINDYAELQYLKSKFKYTNTGNSDAIPSSQHEYEYTSIYDKDIESKKSLNTYKKIMNDQLKDNGFKIVFNRYEYENNKGYTISFKPLK